MVDDDQEPTPIDAGHRRRDAEAAAAGRSAVIQEAIDMLRGLLRAIGAGEVESSATMTARIEGAVVTLEELHRHPGLQ